MPYIQKIELSNDKNMLFVLTDKQYEDLKENQVDYEYKHKDTYKYYNITMKKSSFQYIDDFVYSLISDTGSVITKESKDVNIKSKQEPTYQYFAIVENVMHGDAYLYKTETFIINEETYNTIEKYGLSVDFEIWNKGDSSYNNYIDFSFNCEDFYKCDTRLLPKSYDSHDDFTIDYTLNKSAVKNVIEEFKKENQKIISSGHYVESIPTTSEVDVWEMSSKLFFFNESQSNFADFVRFAIGNMFDTYGLDKKLKTECDDFDFDYHLFSIYESGMFNHEFNISEIPKYYEDFKEHDDHNVLSMFTKESYEKYKEHVMNNNLPKVKEQFPLLYEMFSFDKITEAFLNSGKQWE